MSTHIKPSDLVPFQLFSFADRSDLRRCIAARKLKHGGYEVTHANLGNNEDTRTITLSEAAVVRPYLETQKCAGVR